MCRADYDDSVLLLIDVHRKARKAHICDECARIICAGEQYNYHTYKSDSSVIAHKTCAHCQVGRDWLAENCGGYVYGDVLDEIREHANDYPELRDALTAASSRTHWHADGALLPIPAKPPAISIHH